MTYEVIKSYICKLLIQNIMCTLSRNTIERATEALRLEGVSSPTTISPANGAICVSVQFNGHNYSHVITSDDMHNAYALALQGK